MCSSGDECNSGVCGAAKSGCGCDSTSALIPFALIGLALLRRRR
jgi:uncharacterized protein (TIGR03382 family)